MFKNRVDAGRRLASKLARYRGQDLVVLALPRGGVPVAYEVAHALDAPLDVLVARKIGAPGYPELGVGAVAEDGAFYLNDDLIGRLGVDEGHLQETAREELAELERRVRAYRGDRPLPDVRGRTVILVDDGLATGATVRAAVRALRPKDPLAVVLAVPVCAAATVADLHDELDDAVCVLTPHDLQAVGVWYEDFTQTTDDEVVSLLDEARREHAFVAPPRPRVVAPARGRSP